MISSARLCTGLAWDKDGDTLGIIHDNKSGNNHAILLIFVFCIQLKGVHCKFKPYLYQIVLRI
jgi:hypothetical protein